MQRMKIGFVLIMWTGLLFHYTPEVQAKPRRVSWAVMEMKKVQASVVHSDTVIKLIQVRNMHEFLFHATKNII